MKVTMCAKAVFEPERPRLREAILLFPCRAERDGFFLRLAPRAACQERARTIGDVSHCTHDTVRKNAVIRGR